MSTDTPDSSLTSSVPPEWLIPQWPAPASVHACCTTRQGGVSQPPFDTLNLGDHVGDDPHAVQTNREIVQRALQLPQPPVWLQQVHGIRVLQLPQAERSEPAQADASVSHEAGCVCAVLTADCLPLLFCDRQGTTVAAAHAGWRGLAGGVIEATVAALEVDARDVLVWLGPAIGPGVFEVGEEVRQAFMAHNADAAAAFTVSPSTIAPSDIQAGQSAPESKRWLADLYRLARQRLQALGITQVYGGGLCTWTDQQRFYSFRRESRTGRMASLIWLS